MGNRQAAVVAIIVGCVILGFAGTLSGDPYEYEVMPGPIRMPGATSITVSVPTATETVVGVGETTTLEVSAHDDDGKWHAFCFSYYMGDVEDTPLTYTWDDGKEIEGFPPGPHPATIVWTAPATVPATNPVKITVKVDDTGGPTYADDTSVVSEEILITVVEVVEIPEPEWLGFDCDGPYVLSGSVTNLSNGNFFDEISIVSTRGISPSLNLSLYYNTLDPDDIGLGRGWRHNYAMSVTQKDDDYILTDEDGTLITFKDEDANGTFEAANRFGYAAALVVQADGAIIITERNTTQYTYNADGKLTAIRDKNGNVLSITFDGAKIRTVTDAAGRQIIFGYDANDKLAGITDPAGEVTALTYTNSNLTCVTLADTSHWNYTYNAENLLETKTDPNSNTWAYTYNENNKIISAEDPTGNSSTVVYDEENDQAVLTDKNGKNTTYKYDASLNVTLEKTDPEGNKATKEWCKYRNNTKIIDAKGNETLMDYRGHTGCNICGAAPTKITDAAGNITEHTYDDMANRTSTTDALGSVTTYVYDEDGNLIFEELPDGALTEYEYDSQGNRTKETDALGNGTVYQYDSFGNMTSQTDALDNTTTYTHDIMGRHLTTTDPEGNTTTNEYDVFWDLTKGIDAQGNETAYTYDALGNKTSETDPEGNTTSYEYNFDGQVTKVTNPDGTTEEYTHDPEGNRLTSKNRNDEVTSYEYTASGRLEKVIDPDGLETVYTYDANGNRTAVTDTCDNITQYAYNELDQVTTVTDQEGRETSYAYDALGRRTSITTPEGTTSYEFDSVGNVTKITDPQSAETLFEYDLLGRQTAVIDALGNRTEYEFDALGRVTKVTDPTGAFTQRFYDSRGNLMRQIDALGRETLYEYDSLNRLIAVTNPESHETLYGYDSRGNRTSVTDGEGHVTQYEFDSENRLTRTVYPDGTAVENVYDSAGNLVKVIDQLGREKTFAYNELNQKTAETDALGNTTILAYDTNRNLASITDANGGISSYTYTETNQILGETFPDGSAKTYTYNEAGRMATLTNARGQVVSMTYDPNGRLLEKSWAAGLQSWAYDALSRTTQTTDSDGSTTNSVAYTYDPVGRVLSETQNGVSVLFEYDLVGNKTEVTYPSGTVVAYTYTGADRVRTVSLSGAEVARFFYDGRELMTGAEYGNGVILTRTLDEMGRVLSMVYEKAGETLVGFEYEYDAAGNKLYEKKLHDPEHSQRYLYDDIYRLVEYREGILVDGTIAEPNEKKDWNLDALGNWLSNVKYLSYKDNFAREDTSGQKQDVGGVFTENGSLKSRINGNMLELRRSNNGKVELPALLTVSDAEGAPIDVRSTFFFDKGAPNEEPISAGFLFGYQDPENYSWAGARLENKKEFWAIGQTSSGTHSMLEELQADIPHDTGLGLRLVLDADQAMLYKDANAVLTAAVSVSVGPGGLIGTQNKTLADDFRMTTKVGETREHNAVNELIKRNDTNLLYDEDGNVTDDGAYQYEWDALNRLKTMKDADGNRVASYTYDVWNRRITRIADEDSDGTTETDIRYCYAGWQVVEEQDVTGQTLRTYAYGNYIDEPIYGRSDDNDDGDFLDTGEKFYYVTNTQYSVTAILDTSGNILERYEYTPYGSVTIYTGDGGDGDWWDGDETTGSLTGNFYLFTGRRRDPEADLDYFRNRYYSAELGRFVGRDPTEMFGIRRFRKRICVVAPFNIREFPVRFQRGAYCIVDPSVYYDFQYVDGYNLYTAYFVPRFTDPHGTSLEWWLCEIACHLLCEPFLCPIACVAICFAGCEALFPTEIGPEGPDDTMPPVYYDPDPYGGGWGYDDPMWPDG